MFSVLIESDFKGHNLRKLAYLVKKPHEMSWRKKEKLNELTITAGVSQCPGLIWVKVCISSDTCAREVCVGQESPLTIKRRAVTMETRGKEDHDVSLFPFLLDLWVRNLLWRIRGEKPQSDRWPTHKSNIKMTVRRSEIKAGGTPHSFLMLNSQPCVQ